MMHKVPIDLAATLHPPSLSNYPYYALLPLVEEAQEAAADSENLVQELADLYEVIDALMATQQISREVVLTAQERRHSERGGLTKRLKLIWNEAN